MTSVAPMRSVTRKSFESVASRFQYGKPRITPAPPELVSIPRTAGRNSEATATGLLNRLIPDPPFAGLPDDPTDVPPFWKS
jgi:hypothetical protein